MENLATNTTTPSNPPQIWVPEPKQRGTFGIISLCFSTLIVCTWNNPHLKIPTRRYSAIRRLIAQVSWTLVAFCAPEFLLFLAINEFVKASRLLKAVLELHPHLAEPGMLASMYHFIRRQAESMKVIYRSGSPTSQPHFGLVRAFYAIMGGFAFHRSRDDGNPTIEESPVYIETNTRRTVDIPTFWTLIYLMEHFPDIITNIPGHDIIDPAESSSLSKVLLIIQVGWFCTSCVSRLFQHLSLSLLEVSTAAHAFCTIMTYFVLWSKPMNVAAPTLLTGKEAEEVYALLKCSDDEYETALGMSKGSAQGDSSSPEPRVLAKIELAANALRRSSFSVRPPEPCFEEHHSLMVPRDVLDWSYRRALVLPIATAISPILYGPIHFLAWNGNFPTPLERLLWRISSIVATSSGVVSVCVLFLLSRLNHLLGYKFRLDILANILSVVINGVHVLASGFLLVESFRQLLFLDPTAYELPSWANYWPHIS